MDKSLVKTELIDASQKSTAENAFKSAIYNSLGVAFLVFAIGLCVFLLILLQAFVRPILWALLTGACLFSLKKYLKDITLNSLKSIETNESSITIMLSVSPFKLADRVFDLLWKLFKKNLKNVAIFVGVIVSLKIINSFYERIIVFIFNFFACIATITNFFAVHVDNYWEITLTLILMYFVSVIFYYETIKIRFRSIFQLISIPIWSSIFFLVSHIMGSYRVTCLVVFFILISLGIMANLKEYITKLINEHKNAKEKDSDSEESPNESQDLKNEFEKKPNKLVIDTFKGLLSNRRKSNKKQNNSNKYFIILLWMIIAIKLWSGLYFIPIIILAWKIIKIFLRFTIDFLRQKIDIELMIKWIQEREDFLTPKPFIGLLKLYIRGEQKINEWLQKSLDSLISVLIIVALIAFICMGLILVSMQIHSESIQLISITNNIINENINSYPYMENIFPHKVKVNDWVQLGISNFNLYGRDFITNKLNSILSSTADHENIEKQILDQWDTLCRYLSEKALNGFEKLSKNETTSNNLKKQKSFDLNSFWNIENFDLQFLMVILKDNIGILMSVMDSLLIILKSNINLLINIIHTFTSLVFQGGFAILSFFISFIVYLTALFYFLSSSNTQYKPLKWLNDLAILSTEQNQSLSRTIEDSIQSVFLASLKMAAFYGLYTYLIHTLFEVNIIYISSLLAGFFGFLPIIGTYWASLPGILEIWLIQKSPFQALVFLILHITPTYLVDTAIYSDINYSHPYLTGLAVAGGVYCLGLEGALIGPIVLCLLMVVLKMNKDLLIIPKRK